MSFTPPLLDIEIEHGQKFSARAGIGDQGLAAGIGDHDGLRHGVVSVAAQNNVDAADPARELQIHVHAVVREQQHGVDALGTAQTVDEFLQLLFADAESPIRRETLGMRDRYVGKCLADDADAKAADLLHHCRLEDAAGRGIERRRIVECRFFGQKDVLREELAFDARQILPQNFFAIGEFPVAGHGIDAEEVCGLDHVGALRRVGKAAALPQIAAVEQQRTARTGIRAQPIDQRFQVGEAAHAAVTLCRLLIIEEGEGVRAAAAWRDAKMLEEGAADQVRRLPAHRADADIDARLTEKNRPQLGMGVGEMQYADIAEPADVVKIVVGRHRDVRGDARCRRGGEPAQEIPAIQTRVLPLSGSMNDARLPGGSCSLACAIDAFASASACLASSTAASKSPAAAAFFAAANACSVVVHWFLSAPASFSAPARPRAPH